MSDHFNMDFLIKCIGYLIKLIDNMAFMVFQPGMPGLSDAHMVSRNHFDVDVGMRACLCVCVYPPGN